MGIRKLMYFLEVDRIGKHTAFERQIIHKTLNDGHPDICDRFEAHIQAIRQYLQSVAI